MNNAGALGKIWCRDYTDVLGLDVGGSGLKAVRMKLVNQQIVVLAADILPVIPLSLEEGDDVVPLNIPKPLKARHVAFAVASGGNQIKLLSFPTHSEKTVEAHVVELMGISDRSQYRIAYESLTETRTEVRVLAVAIPEMVGRKLCRLCPEGTPAPCSIESAGLASMTAFEKGPGLNHGEDCVAAIDFGMNGAVVSFYNRGALVLVRKLEFGAVNILRKLQDNLGVEQDVAMGILNDGSFDVSRVVHAAIEPFLQQLVISWDFVERRENVHIQHLYACGGGARLGLWAQELEAATGKKPVLWNPFDDLSVQPGAFPQRLKGQESRFTAAIGAARAILGTR